MSKVKIYLLTNRDSRWANVHIGQVWRGERANEKFSWSYHHVARNQSKTVSDLSFLANIHTAKEIAKRENISNIFALK